MKKIIMIILLVIMVFFIFSCGITQDSQGDNDPDDETTIESEAYSDTLSNSESIRVQMNDAELVDTATHIIDAKLIGMENDYKSHWVLLFEPIETYKGNLGEDSEVMRVDAEWIDGVEPGDCSPLKEGEIYLLMMEKFISVFRDHSIYATLNSTPMASDDDEWDEYHNNLKSYIEASKAEAKTEIGIPFMESDNIEDIIEFADSIFVVNITSKEYESEVRPTTLYNVELKKTLKGNPVNEDFNSLSFLNDTVEVGKDYVVMLSREDDVYALASRNNSVFALKDVDGIPELKELFEKAE